MSHETENPLIIDVVGEVEPPESSEQHASKKAERSAGKKRFFRKEKAASEASAPSVQQPVQQAVQQSAQPQVQQPVQPVQTQVQQPVQPIYQPAQAVQSQPQPPVQQPAQVSQPQQQPQTDVQQPQVQAQPQGVAQVAPAPQPQAAPVSQVQAPAQPAQPVQQGTVSVSAPPMIQQGNMAAAVATTQRSKAVYVFGILAILVAVFALAVAGFYAFLQMNNRTPLAPTTSVDFESTEVRPIGSVSLDQASKVSLRATAENWSEEGSTPVIAYIKRVEESTSSGNGDKDAANSADVERYFAFAPNKNASVSLPAGRYTFSFIAPMNADGSMYTVPDMVNMVVGDGGMAILPVDLKLIPKDEVTQEQVTRGLAQLKTASEKSDESFAYEPFERSIDLALNTWFPQSDTTTEVPATDLTQEQQQALDAQADTRTVEQNGQGGGTQAATNEHTHDWVAQHEQRWQPAIVPVIDTAAWESPVYARYRCQEGILFETLEACLTHVRERGNESYTESNEIIRIDYHPAVVHYEEQGKYEDVITGYRCSICGVTGTL